MVKAWTADDLLEQIARGRAETAEILRGWRGWDGGWGEEVNLNADYAIQVHDDRRIFLDGCCFCLWMLWGSDQNLRCGINF